MGIENYKSKIQNSPKRFPAAQIPSERIITIYTVFYFLIRMKERMGLEGMLEYIESYMKEVDEFCPQMPEAIVEAVKTIQVKNKE